MFKVVINGREFTTDYDGAVKEWAKGARVYDEDGREVDGIEMGKRGNRLIFKD